jgi:maleylacetate reductase
MCVIARALNVDDAAAGVHDLASSLGATMALRDLGMPASGIAAATELSLATPYWNPRPLERTGIQALLAQAYQGSRPS